MTKAQLSDAVESYRKGLHENETTSCMIPLLAIQNLIKHYSDPDIIGDQKPISGFRIYFYRPKSAIYADRPSRSIYPIADGRGQMSVILVPTHNYQEVINGNDRNGVSVDMFIENGECKVFIPGGEHTGLCPKNCPQ